MPEDQAAAYRPRPPPLWTAADAIARIGQLLGVLSERNALASFVPGVDEAEPGRALRHRAAVAATLVGRLELARTGVLSLEQAAAWAPIEVRRNGGGRDDARAHGEQAP